MRYGSSTEFLSHVETYLLRQSFVIALIAVVLPGAVLIVLAYWLTRRLRSLTHASQAIAKDCFDIFVEDAETLKMLARLDADNVQRYYLEGPYAEHPATNGLQGKAKLDTQLSA